VSDLTGNLERYSYLAGPYTHALKEVMAWRAELLTAKAAELTREGLVIFSPITHGHAMASRHSLPTGIEYWERVDRVFLSHAKELLILKLDGWDTSKGVALEIKLAREWGIPYRHIEP